MLNRSTLALAAFAVFIPPTATPLNISLSLLVGTGTKPNPKDAGSIPACSEPTRKTSKTVSKAKMHPGNTTNGWWVQVHQSGFAQYLLISCNRNLCALHWLKQTKHSGTTDEFNAYHGTLTSDQLGVSHLLLVLYMLTNSYLIEFRNTMRKPRIWYIVSTWLSMILINVFAGVQWCVE